MRGGVYCARKVAVEMFWESCEDEDDFVVSGKGVYGGGGPRAAVLVELRGPTMGGVEGVKRKGRFGKDAAVAEDARLRVWPRVLWLEEETVRLRRVVGVCEVVATGTAGKGVAVPLRE
jgi:hypothetical protein